MKFLVVLAVACGHPVHPTAGDADAEIDRAARAITADELRETIKWLSSDQTEGRGPTTAGDVATRAYLAKQLEQLGYAPRGDGGDAAFDQKFDLVGVQAKMPKEWTFTRGDRSVKLAWWEQFIAASGVQAPAGKVDGADLVFVGYGIQAPEYGWDDFKGMDLHGKVLVMMNNDPDWDPALFGGTTRLYYGRWTYKYESAARVGAAGAIIIHTTPSAGYPWQVVQTSWSGREFELEAGSEPRIQLKGWVTEDAARVLAELAGKDLAALVESAKRKEFKPVPLGIKTSLAFTNDITRGVSANVVGVLHGSDPKLADEYVVLTAHHDHLGIGKPDATGDTIYNGALDNASGCAQVLAIAKAVKALPTPPRRSIVIAFVGGEEQGLLGSAFYAAHPTGKLVADINFDGGNIWAPTRDVTYIGKAKTTLDPVVDKYAARQHRTVVSDQFPDRGYFYRSDQFSFAKTGVPGIYLSAGTDAIGKPAGWMKEQILDYETHHYHQPSDELKPTWNFDGMVQDTSLGFALGVAIANADSPPAFLPGDEFARARK